MAVEFLCPHCRTRMRTPDEAMRKPIDCPACGKSLRVPVVEIGPAKVPVTIVEPAAAVATEATPPPATVPAADRFDFLADDAPDEASSGNATGLPESPAADADAATTGRTGRGKRGRKSRGRKKTPWGLWAVVLGLVVFIAGAVYKMQAGAPAALTGALAATAADGSPRTGTVAYPATVGEADRERVVDAFGTQPVNISTASVTVSVTADADGLGFTVTPADGTKTVAVDLTSDAGLAAWLAANGPAKSAERAAKREAAIGSLMADLIGEEIRPNAVAAYFDSVFLATLQREIGWAVVANVGGTAIPVMEETTDGTLLFAIPATADLLTVQPRPGQDESILPRPFAFNAAVAP